MTSLSVAVVGAGWSGLAAAVRATEAGHRVTVIEMAPQPGGRARSDAEDGETPLDNGQHILVGAYARTLALMRTVGVDPDAALLRQPFELRFADGRHLVSRGGAAVPAFLGAILRCNAWSPGDKASAIAACSRWLLRRFRCDPRLTVAELTSGMSAPVRELFVEPLCVAALNTPASAASAEVFLRVLRDALFGGPGSSDLLLPRRPLQELLPAPAIAWLLSAGAAVRWRRRAQTLVRDGAGWLLDGERYDRIVLACSAVEAARLTSSLAPAWSALAAALRYEPIVTVYAERTGAALDAPMWALREGPAAPAQFVFDLGRLGGPPGRLAFVISGAAAWVEAGREATVAAIRRQAAEQLPPAVWGDAAVVLAHRCERRATFRCVPRLQRPPTAIAPGCHAAGDYVEGPYPATLEGAIRAGEAAASAL